MILFYRSTQGIRISAQPFFVPEQSDPEEPRYVFVYHVRIENQGETAARLLWRRWYIHDPVGGDSEVEGEGVVGEQPLVEPGEVYEYQSFTVLRAPNGFMEGHYQFQRPDGATFDAAIPRFLLRIHAA